VIPIQNLYYLLCYAWNRLPETELVDIEALPKNDLPNLLGKLLASGVSRLLRQGIDRGYISERVEVRGLRGKLDVSHSLKRLLLHQPAAACVVDELQREVLHNRIIKTTLLRLSQTTELEQDLRHRLRSLRDQLVGVSDIDVQRRCFRQVQLHRNNRFYRFLLNVCELCHLSLLADEREGRWRFMDFERDEAKMRDVFQDFVLNFFRIEQREFAVSRERFHWTTSEPPTGEVPLLPTMTTDVSLVSKARKIVVECKFSKEVLQANWGKSSARSEHLYQLYAYLRNLEARGKLDKTAEGLLLYPTVHDVVDFSFSTAGHSIRVYTLNLDRKWEAIKADMLALLRPTHPQSQAGAAI